MEEIKSPEMSRSSSALRFAVRAGSVALVKCLLWTGADGNARGYRETTALHLACESEHKSKRRVVDALLRAGADINAKSWWAETPLHKACRSMNSSVVITLLRHGAKIGSANEYGSTALHLIAAMPLDHATIPIVQALIANTASDGSGNRSSRHLVDHPEGDEIVSAVNARDRSNNTALHLASARDNENLVCLLLRLGAKVGVKNNDGMTALQMAVKESAIDVIKALVVNGEDLNDKDVDGNTLLHLAFAKTDSSFRSSDNEKNKKLVWSLLSMGAKVGVKNSSGMTALHMAVRACAGDVISVLVDFGEDLNAKDWNGHTSLDIAIRNNRIEEVRLLLLMGANRVVDRRRGETILLKAVKACAYDVVNFLVDIGEDVNDQDSSGNTPLHIASIHNYKVAVCLFLRSGAKVGVQNNKGMTALHCAARRFAKDAVSILLNNGEDVNAQDLLGNTPLHTACKCDNEEVVLLLLRSGANVGVKNHAGETALHVAARSLAEDIVYELVDHGAYVSAKDFKGNTPLHFCSRSFRFFHDPGICRRIANFLINEGAKVNCQNIHLKTPYLELPDPSSMMHQIEEMKKIEEIFIKEDVRLKALGIENVLPFKWRLGPGFYENVRNRCLQEFEEMKSTNVVKDISLYQVLTHSNQPFVLSSGDLLHVAKFLSSTDLRIRFPLYGDSLRTTFQRAELLTLTLDSFYTERRKQIVKELPRLVSEHLLTFMSKEDMKTFIDSE